MTIFKMTENTVTVSCRCGAENEIPIESLEIQGDGIVFPCDKEGCNGIGGFLTGDHKFENPAKEALSELLQTLAKRLFDAGQVSETVPTAEPVFVKGKQWKKDDAIEIQKINYARIPVKTPDGEVVAP